MSEASFVIERVSHQSHAAIAQLGERQTEDLKVPGSIPGLGTNIYICMCVSVLHWIPPERSGSSELRQQRERVAQAPLA